MPLIGLTRAPLGGGGLILGEMPPVCFLAYCCGIVFCQMSLQLLDSPGASALHRMVIMLLVGCLDQDCEDNAKRTGRNAPSTFPSIVQKRKGIELQNFRNPFLHQFCTGWPKENFAPMIGRPWVTSEWRHVLPFLVKNKGLHESLSHAVTRLFLMIKTIGKY